MALTSHSSSGSVEGKNGVGDTRRSVQVNKVFWKASNPRGFRLQKLMSDDHLAGMLNAVENAFQIGQRAYDKKLQQGFRLTKFCRIELPNAWQWKSRQTSRGIHQQKPLGTAVLSTRMTAFPGALTANAAGGGSQEIDELEAQFRVPEVPGFDKLLKHPLALISFVPREVALFFAGAMAGAAAKTVTAPLDRVKLLMQVHGVRMAQEGSSKSIGLLEAVSHIGNQEGMAGFWKGNVPQVVRVIPYSAVQLFAYEAYKKLFKGEDEELSIVGRLAAGACAGMTSTLVTYPLDVLRLRLAVDSTTRSMGQVAGTMLREEGLKSFYKGLGPSLLGIAPYIALNFCVFDLVKKSLPEELRKKPEASFLTALVSASFATTMCYPLDTARRQMQMKGSPFNSFLDAIPGIVARDGFHGLYRGFVPNVLKNLPNSRCDTFVDINLSSSKIVTSCTPY
ncbi:probable envelope ADP,ATP carrier protein, chloroplastic isoform X2 [Physcomitrium patens]|uniref:probable envelope ADP,ATP carrier protein, chloroplastic isoform X2 n=1 Tax=Physcomitrium patens TaxID=3218 RepID=UPI000D17049E|nr:probable envelope ADP,ATP carrier protein, chloroplastic isoform X2 [Physcomitrium patens]|eukprot:XP_024390888.1 probable envelope ADP,ATP carrier protein, chloroplastic isoform X2 [Physcomitrella patens]